MTMQGCYTERMRWRGFFLTIAMGFCLVASVRATEPEAIFIGYGKTRWGQTIEEVKTIYPQMTEVSRYRKLEKVPLDSSTSEDDSGYPLDRFFASPVAEPLQEMVFGFADGKLYMVEIAFSATVRAKLDDLALAHMVWDKYFAPEDSRKRIEQSHSDIHVVTRKGGSLFITDRPQGPEQLLQPNEFQYGNFDLGVFYKNGATESHAFDEAGAREQKVKDQRGREAAKAAEELGIRDVL